MSNIRPEFKTFAQGGKPILNNDGETLYPTVDGRYATWKEIAENANKIVDQIEKMLDE